MPNGVKTLVEISSQPAVWQRCLNDLQHADLHRFTDGHSPLDVEWVFIGCGTSYYLAQAAAFSFTSLLNTAARAVPASEALLRPELVFPSGAKSYYPVLISRSGHTSEVLNVAEVLNSKGVPFLAVTCDGRELAGMTDKVLKLNVEEESTVMTSSFTSMLLGLQYLAATFANNKDFIEALHQLPKHLERLLDTYNDEVVTFARKAFEDIAFLGQGALYPIAAESALKVMESSSTFAQYFHTLEFRHGPKSIAGASTLVGALISDSGYDAESAVLLEMKDLGSRILAVVNTAGDKLCEQADLVIELDLPVPELARLVIYVVWGQLLGSYRGLEKGLNPDHPRNLSRVVTI
jgi:glucosamine--fructose-6-phosphate aminotransferase (isomerizing)